MYCTQQNLIDRYGESELIRLTNPDDPAAAIIDAAVLSAAIADAAAEIDGYITSWLPLSPVPSNFERMACDMVRFYLHKDLPTKAVEDAYIRHIDYLGKIAMGKIRLGPDAGGSLDPRPSDTVSITSSDTVFTRDAY